MYLEKTLINIGIAAIIAFILLMVYLIASRGKKKIIKKILQEESSRFDALMSTLQLSGDKSNLKPVND